MPSNARDAIQRLTLAKDAAYAERNQLVALLPEIFPAWLERHPETDTSWDHDWRIIVLIQTPNGQASWHIHGSEAPMFRHLDLREGHSWDGHTTEEKYRWLAVLTLWQLSTELVRGAS